MNVHFSSVRNDEREQEPAMEQLLAERSVLLQEIQSLQAANDEALQRIGLLMEKLEQTVQDIWKFQGKHNACELFLAADRLHAAWQYKQVRTVRGWPPPSMAQLRVMPREIP